ncbi:hypothetical protein FB451DRAFT_1301894, partial [Mycena latifolia]
PLVGALFSLRCSDIEICAVRKEHKYSCRLGAGDVERDVPAEYLAQKFAEHLMRVPWLITLIDMYAVVALGLDVDLSNATRSCLCARITTKPVPGAAKNLAMLQFERFEIKPVSVLTSSMTNALKQRRLLAGPNARPPLLVYFSTDGDNFLFMPHEVLPQLIAHAANRPVFDDGGAITAEKVVSELNEFIRLDTKNACKLRGVRRELMSSVPKLMFVAGLEILSHDFFYFSLTQCSYQRLYFQLSDR